ncbi:hypothetical protein HK100_008516 [Physocladia obscura]|uniref:Uncharacterized protein n=1 Tax=Physocladia obscura TaxID=109957 RepID=A0AAD5SPJ2_9FUNG|nr:hypothetical protein HK100_008516 [Physocladia obscura]
MVVEAGAEDTRRRVSGVPVLEEAVSLSIMHAAVAAAADGNSCAENRRIEYFTDGSLLLGTCFPQILGYEGGNLMFAYNNGDEVTITTEIPPSPPPPTKDKKNSRKKKSEKSNNAKTAGQKKGDEQEGAGKKKKKKSSENNSAASGAKKWEAPKYVTTRFTPPPPVNVFYDVLTYATPPIQLPPMKTILPIKSGDVTAAVAKQTLLHNRTTAPLPEKQRRVLAVLASVPNVPRPYVRPASAPVDALCPLLLCKEPSVARLYSAAAVGKNSKTRTVSSASAKNDLVWPLSTAVPAARNVPRVLSSPVERMRVRSAVAGVGGRRWATEEWDRRWMDAMQKMGGGRSEWEQMMNRCHGQNVDEAVDEDNDDGWQSEEDVEWRNRMELNDYSVQLKAEALERIKAGGSGGGKNKNAKKKKGSRKNAGKKKRKP